jgi:hypothetical protein
MNKGLDALFHSAFSHFSGEGEKGPLSDADVGAILRRLGPRYEELDDADRVVFRRHINALWVMDVGLKEAQGRALPHRIARRMDRIHMAASELRSALRGIGFEFEIIDLIELAQQVEPDSATPGTAALTKVVKAVAQVRLIEDLAIAAYKEQRRKINAYKSQFAKPREGFAIGLAKIFQRMFVQPTPATRGGDWEIFLQETLSRCEGKPCSEERAHQLWVKARKAFTKEGYRL